MNSLLTPQQLEAALRDIGAKHYHNLHPFHRRMDAGELTPESKSAVAKAVGRKKPAAVRSGRVSAATKSGSKAAIRGKTTLRKSKSRRG